MKRSVDRILTTHVGSLPRSEEMDALVRDKDRERLKDLAGFRDVAKAEVAEVVQKQVAAGLTIVNDGEVSKSGYAGYFRERLDGFAREEVARQPRQGREAEEFPEYYTTRHSLNLGTGPVSQTVCVGPLGWRDFT